MSPSIIQLDTGKIIRVVNGQQTGYCCDIIKDSLSGKIFRVTGKQGSYVISSLFRDYSTTDTLVIYITEQKSGNIYYVRYNLDSKIWDDLGIKQNSYIWHWFPYIYGRAHFGDYLYFWYSPPSENRLYKVNYKTPSYVRIIESYGSWCGNNLSNILMFTGNPYNEIHRYDLDLNLVFEGTLKNEEGELFEEGTNQARMNDSNIYVSDTSFVWVFDLNGNFINEIDVSEKVLPSYVSNTRMVRDVLYLSPPGGGGEEGYVEKWIRNLDTTNKRVLSGLEWKKNAVFENRLVFSPSTTEISIYDIDGDFIETREIISSNGSLKNG